MKLKTVDLSKTLKPYSNEWVVLDSKTMKVVAAEKDANKALEIARKKGINHPVLTRAPQEYGTYIL